MVLLQLGFHVSMEDQGCPRLLSFEFSLFFLDFRFTIAPGPCDFIQTLIGQQTQKEETSCVEEFHCLNVLRVKRCPFTGQLSPAMQKP